MAEVNTVPPPLPVAAPGPLRVELRLASGQCEAKGEKGVKGCSDGNLIFRMSSTHPVHGVVTLPSL